MIATVFTPAGENASHSPFMTEETVIFSIETVIETDLVCSD